MNIGNLEVTGVRQVCPGALAGTTEIDGVPHRVLAFQVMWAEFRQSGGGVKKIQTPPKPLTDTSMALCYQLLTNIMQGPGETVSIPGYPGEWLLAVFPGVKS